MAIFETTKRKFLNGMKKLFLIALLLSYSIGCVAQSNSFTTDNDKLIWENVFISSETNIPNLIARHTRLKITSVANAVYRGYGTDVRNTCPGTSDFLKDDFSFNFEIEPRDGKYRVTITNIIFSKKVKTKKSATASEKLLLEKGALKTGTKAEADFTCLENYFTKIFSMTSLYKNRS